MTFLLGLILAGFQMNTLQEKQVVHLPPHTGNINIKFGGQCLELIDAEPAINLPVAPPKPDIHGVPWSVDVKNMGPGVVVVVGKAQFRTQISVGQTVHIVSNGAIYSLRR